jgi:FixJ family two-component response regulator
VCESLELLICCADWQPQTFASAQEFLARPTTPCPELPTIGDSAFPSRLR